MKTSTILKRAERYLWDGHGTKRGKSVSLCGALGMASRDKGWEAVLACAHAQAHIMRALCGSVTYANWAVSEKLLPAHWYDEPETWYPTVQSNRLNWLRELQQKLEFKGD